MNIQEIALPVTEYINEVTQKSMIFLHHTAGGHRPDAVINSWKNDRDNNGNPIRVATSFVIGGISTTTNDTAYDGKIVRCFPESKWAYHLGIGGALLNKKSIGIELCNYGPLTFQPGRGFVNYVNTIVPEAQVIELPVPFRGYKYYHKYTNRQLDSLSQLLNQLCSLYSINRNLGLKASLTANAANPAIAFGVNPNALNAASGIWTHTNVRQDKSDCSPQLPLISLLKSL
ncbi:peptidoglycan recognition protein family protein [Runella sp.]|uniref:peptidoglycan recognition protein family protein n=1 Tax=Runella sp. TaxID=1960881 RepID=UPI003D09FC05